MASTISISDFIHIFYKKIFEASPGADDTAGEPHLVLGFAYNVDGERLEDINIAGASSHAFPECDPWSLQAFVQAKEPLPLDTMVDPQDAQMAREAISDAVASLVRSCVGVEGLRRLQVDVVVEISQEEEEEEDYGLNDVDDGLLVGERRRRMSLVRRSVCMEEEVCAVCLEEMREGEEVVCTPCVHRFHGECVGRWFENTGVCPLCRFQIDLF